MADNLTDSLGSFTRSISGRRVEASTPMEFWTGMSQAVVERIAENWEKTNR